MRVEQAVSEASGDLVALAVARQAELAMDQESAELQASQIIERQRAEIQQLRCGF